METCAGDGLCLCGYCYNEANENSAGSIITKDLKYSDFAFKIYDATNPCCVCLDKCISNTSPCFVNTCGHWTCIACHLAISRNTNKCPACNIKIDHEKKIQIGGAIIFIRINGISAYYIDIENTLVSELKELIKLREGYKDDVRLLWSGKQLSDDRTLKDYKIKRGAIITLVMRLRGD